MGTIDITRDGPVATIRIQREHVLNALDPVTLGSLVAAAESASSDPDVRAIVLSGGTRAFTTGEDLNEAARLDADAFRRQIVAFQRLATVLRHAPKPTIAAVAGPAYGGGVEIAVNCDARIAATNAVFACPEVGWSLTLTNGSSVLLRRLIGDGWTRELLLLGRVIDATQALRIGLVTRVVEPDHLEAVAIAAAHVATSGDPDAIRLTKELLNADPRGWRETLDAETVAVCGAFAGPSARARLAAFATRRRSRDA